MDPRVPTARMGVMGLAHPISTGRGRTASTHGTIARTEATIQTARSRARQTNGVTGTAARKPATKCDGASATVGARVAAMAAAATAATAAVTAAMVAAMVT